MRGFSIVEVMIVVAIIAVFSLIVTFADDDFIDNSSRNIVAHDLAISINLLRNLIETGQFDDDETIYLKVIFEDSDAYDNKKIASSYKIIKDRHINGISNFRDGMNETVIKETDITASGSKNVILNICQVIPPPLSTKVCANGGFIGGTSYDCPRDPTRRASGDTYYITLDDNDNIIFNLAPTNISVSDGFICMGSSFSGTQSLIRVDNLGRAIIQNSL